MIETLKRFARPTVHRLRSLLRPNRLGPTPTGELTPGVMLQAYLQGYFPLGRPNGKVDWQTLPERAVIGIDSVHVSKRLRTYLRNGAFEIRFNERFSEVVAGCSDRDKTWINAPLAAAYDHLHRTGVAHSVEAYQEGRLVGGGYGLAIGRVFFLESMFCTVDHASKVAFVRLAEKLGRDGFECIDCQYLSEHWKRFGAKPMPREELCRLTLEGLDAGSRFSASVADVDAVASAERIEDLIAAGG